MLELRYCGGCGGCKGDAYGLRESDFSSAGRKNSCTIKLSFVRALLQWVLLPKMPLTVSSLSLEGLEFQSAELKSRVPRGHVPKPPNKSDVWLEPNVIDRANTKGPTSDSK